MKSKMNISSHPLHPILIVFPIAFFIGSFMFDLFGWIGHKDIFYSIAYYLNIAGIVGAILAAIPGIVDYYYIVPPKSSAKSRAAKHGIINSVALVIFIAALYLKNAQAIPMIGITLIELFAVILLCIAGWMGGTLVYRNQIGVDHRFAFAGKYREDYYDDSENAIMVGRANELKRDQMKLLNAKGKRIVLARMADSYVAFEDGCTHRGASMADGVMICGTVQCPWHGSQFDVKTGAVKAGPAEKALKTYKVEERDGKIYVKL